MILQEIPEGALAFGVALHQCARAFGWSRVWTNSNTYMTCYSNDSITTTLIIIIIVVIIIIKLAIVLLLLLLLLLLLSLLLLLL